MSVDFPPLRLHAALQAFSLKFLSLFPLFPFRPLPSQLTSLIRCEFIQISTEIPLSQGNASELDLRASSVMTTSAGWCIPVPCPPLVVSVSSAVC